MENYKISINTQVKIALLSVIGFILMFLSTPLIIFPSFLRLDISDLPEVIAWMQFGLLGGILTALLKNVLHLFITQSAGIGELINFIVASLYLISLNLVFRKAKSLKISLIVGTIFIGILSIPVNRYIMFPLYEAILHIRPENIVSLAAKSNPLIKNLNLYLALIIMPFNLFKFLVVSILSYSLKGILKIKI